MPDMSDPVFIYYHEKLIHALGERYDGHPDLAEVDLGSIGMWGEGRPHRIAYFTSFRNVS